jgi:predicted phage gp36 major capsid-like protein
MALHRDSMERPLGTSLKATYRALLARGLEAGEAANLTAFLHGLPSDGFHWTLPEIEAIIRRRLAHAADERLAAATNNLAVPPRDRRRSTIHDRRSARSGSTHVIDPPKP